MVRNKPLVSHEYFVELFASLRFEQTQHALQNILVRVDVGEDHAEAFAISLDLRVYQVG